MNGTIDWRVTRLLASGSVPATIVTLTTLSWLGRSNGHAANGLITSALGVALLLTAAAILFRRFILDHIARHTDRLSERRIDWLTIILGAFLGVIVSISSVGAGAIGMTVLMALYSRLPTVRLVGSDIAHAVPLTFVAGLGYWMMGEVNWPLLVALLIGSLPGIWLGAQLTRAMPERLVRGLLCVSLVTAGLKVIH